VKQLMTDRKKQKEWREGGFKKHKKKQKRGKDPLWSSKTPRDGGAESQDWQEAFGLPGWSKWRCGPRKMQGDGMQKTGTPSRHQTITPVRARHNQNKRKLNKGGEKGRIRGE